MEAKNPSRIVGMFVLLGLVLIAGLVINFSKGASILTPGYTISIRAQTVGGLKLGASVMMAGVPVGSVKGIELAKDGRSVLIRCRIEQRYTIYADARFSIEQSGFLGDQFVAIEPTANAGKVVGDGAEVNADAPFNLLEAARSAVALMQRLDSAAAKIDVAIDRVERQLLSAETISNLTVTVRNVRRVSEGAEGAVRDVQELVRSNTPLIAGSVSNFNAFSVKLSDLADRISGVTSNANSVVLHVDGVVQANKDEIHAALVNLKASSDNIRQISADLQAGKGTAGALLKDEKMPAQLNEILANMNTVSSNLAKYGLLYKPKAALPKSPLENSKYSGRSGLR